MIRRGRRVTPPFEPVASNEPRRRNVPAEEIVENAHSSSILFCANETPEIALSEAVARGAEGKA